MDSPVEITVENLSAKDSSDFMGLEKCLTKESLRQIIFRRRGIVDAVLREQHRQLGIGTYDASMFALVSEEWSGWSRERARILGLLHAS